jgi:hypothetical protein
MATPSALAARPITRTQTCSSGNGALALAQHAQHGAVVQMAGRKAARRQRHGHRAEHARPAAPPGSGTSRRGPCVWRISGRPVSSDSTRTPRTSALLDLGIGPLANCAHLPRRPRHRKPVAQAAGRLHQAGGLVQVGLVEHHARRESS